MGSTFQHSIAFNTPVLHHSEYSRQCIYMLSDPYDTYFSSYEQKLWIS
jgi:hypothetical protein